MKKVVITGANGFIGRNLSAHLRFRNDCEVIPVTSGESKETVEQKMKNADVVYHLAGANRPADPAEFDKVNTQFTSYLLQLLETQQRPFRFIFTSSAQAVLDNPYGKSKLAGEKALQSQIRNGELVTYRLPGVFGKWCRPNYNSVVATFCHNVANDKPLDVRDPQYMLTLVYIDDVVSALVKHLDAAVQQGHSSVEQVLPEYTVPLGQLATTISSFKSNRQTLLLPHVGNALEKALYSTYLTYLPENSFSYPLELRSDNRGTLFELLKSKDAGQVFISTTLPGITRGNHFHHTKTEKFVVIAGKGLICLRNIDSSEIIEYAVSGDKPEVVDIPPGYTHNITNTGTDVMITLFWANEIFEPARPDTQFINV